MPRQWTPEQRKELGERMKAARLAKKSAQVEESTNQIATLNPIATDVVISPVVKASRVKPLPTASPSPFSPDGLIAKLEAIPLGTISYADCGLLLNALSKASTEVALARRQRQEQLEAGSQRATCKTCGRAIDISKSGGFQILTERDEFHMPKNSYYCSQNCLLARNMPSHARQTSRDKKENRA